MTTQAAVPVGDTAPAHFARVLALQAIHNFRDYGGYGVAGGGSLKTGLLFRSSQHWGASSTDLEVVSRLGLATVFDLRGPRERSTAPCPRPEGFSAQILCVEADTSGLAAHVEAAESGGPLTREAARAAMLKSYAGMPFRHRLIPMLSRYFEVLASRAGPSLIHCMAGKDRTGFAVSLFHHALGVSHDDMIQDYLLTNTAADAQARVTAGARHIRGAWGHDIADEAIDVLMGVDADYVEVAFEAIRARHGSVDAYLCDVLGLTEARRGALRERLVD